MQEEQDQRQARRFYESLEYHVDSDRCRQRPAERRADYLVTGFGDTILTEVKSRVPDEDYEAALETDGHALREDLLARSTRFRLTSGGPHGSWNRRPLPPTPLDRDVGRFPRQSRSPGCAVFGHALRRG